MVKGEALLFLAGHFFSQNSNYLNSLLACFKLVRSNVLIKPLVSTGGFCNFSCTTLHPKLLSIIKSHPLIILCHIPAFSHLLLKEKENGILDLIEGGQTIK
jgi:hypothetical protein